MARWRPIRSPSRSCSGARTPACPWKSCSIRGSGTCSSSGSPATSSRRPRSAAWSSRPRFQTWLVVVFGHSRCGAVQATLDELQRPTPNQPPDLRSIVDRVRPSVDALLMTELKRDPEALVRQAVRSNIRVSANHVRYGSALLEQSDRARRLGGRRPGIFAGNGRRGLLRRRARSALTTRLASTGGGFGARSPAPAMRTRPASAMEVRRSSAFEGNQRPLGHGYEPIRCRTLRIVSRTCCPSTGWGKRASSRPGHDAERRALQQCSRPRCCDWGSTI